MKYKIIPERLYAGIEDWEFSENPEVILPEKWQFLKVETVLKRDPSWDPESVPSLNSPGEVTIFIVDVLRELQSSDRERLYALFTDRYFRIHGLHEVSIGTATETLGHPRELFRAAIVAGANNIFLIHNHPSGVLEISGEDKKLMRRIKEVGQLVGIPLRDFIIVGHRGEYYSAREHGLL